MKRLATVAVAPAVQPRGDLLDPERSALTVPFKIEREDAANERCLGLIDRQNLLVLVPSPFGDQHLVAERRPRAVPEALLGVRHHGAPHVLGSLGALIFVELAEDRADEIARRPLPYVLSNRDQLDLRLGELAPVALELELIPEEAAEAVDDHQIIGAVASNRCLDHRLELWPIVVGRRCSRLAVHVDQQDAPPLAIGGDRRDLVCKAGLVLSLPSSGHADIGCCSRSDLRKPRYGRGER
ncbi:hypothetical protein LZ518_05920 [Sphingomonas sp. RB56-2]|uniref:Uncharacterized protein n=1 Tax=Sphingomonas brevis TaxID=2908206 RepID=A0ABT0S8J7_9SPHN|nr:hypothetical protein [Sphingomonas brevis]MCL6740668.1 hypothetical protein [Sphingomonas brevis]